MSFTHAHDALKLANEKREEIAKTVFDYDRVAERITMAAKDGQNGLQLAQKQPLDLRHTTYAKGLVNKLKKAGYETMWIEATQKETIEGRETTGFHVYGELLIKWGHMMRRGSQNEMPE